MAHNSPPAAAMQYFSGLASVYADHRPGYPLQAIDWILDGLPEPIHAADIGCGTGISARLLASRSVHVIGIDPNLDMLQQARRTTPDLQPPIHYRQGNAERTGLATGRVNLVVCAQSFHWFDALAALREFHRITCRGGRLALMWNIKSPDNEFSAGFIRNVEQAQADAAARGLVVPQERAADATLGGYFINMRQMNVANPQPLNLEGVLGRARSASYFPKSGPVRDQLEQDLIELFHRHRRDGIVTLCHRTEVTLADRADSIDPDSFA